MYNKLIENSLGGFYELDNLLRAKYKVHLPIASILNLEDQLHDTPINFKAKDFISLKPSASLLACMLTK